jgi:hypothetical protein
LFPIQIIDTIATKPVTYCCLNLKERPILVFYPVAQKEQQKNIPDRAWHMGQASSACFYLVYSFADFIGKLLFFKKLLACQRIGICLYFVAAPNMKFFCTEKKL